MVRKYLSTTIVILSFMPSIFAQHVYNIKDFGAVGDGQTVNTSFIQAAIDACAERGGQVSIPPGCFVTGTVCLKTNVSLYLSPGATLKGSSNLDDYPDMEHTGRSLICAYNRKNVSITGSGTIDGSGDHPAFQSNDQYNGMKGRPHNIAIVSCSEVKLKEFTMRNGTAWQVKVKHCTSVTVHDVSVIGRVVANNDGLDIVDSHDVRVSDCYFDCGDDAICPKSYSTFGVKNLVITNCIIKSESNGIKFGTPGVGGFEDVTISNCVIYDTRLSGIALELVDGGIFDRITINNIVMHNVNGGLFIKLGKRKGDKPGILRNVTVSNLIADGIGCWQPDTTSSYFKPAKDSKIGMSIVGQPGHRIENVTLQNVYMQFAGGGTLEDAKLVMYDKPGSYPEYHNYGVSSAYAFICRHVKNLTFDNVRFEAIKEDKRPAFFFEDAEGVDISRFHAVISDQASCFIRCKNVKDFFIHDCKPQSAPVPFLLFEGKVEDITVINNDFRKVKDVFRIEDKKYAKEINTGNNLIPK